MSNDDKIRALAQRGFDAPESLTLDEIRGLGMAALCDLYDNGEAPQPEPPNLN